MPAPPRPTTSLPPPSLQPPPLPHRLPHPEAPPALLLWVRLGSWPVCLACFPACHTPSCAGASVTLRAQGRRARTRTHAHTHPLSLAHSFWHSGHGSPLAMPTRQPAARRGAAAHLRASCAGHAARPHLGTRARSTPPRSTFCRQKAGSCCARSGRTARQPSAPRVPPRRRELLRR
jgi:hypothetical protein